MHADLIPTHSAVLIQIGMWGGYGDRGAFRCIGEPAACTRVVASAQPGHDLAHKHCQYMQAWPETVHGSETRSRTRVNVRSAEICWPLLMRAFAASEHMDTAARIMGASQPEPTGCHSMHMPRCASLGACTCCTPFQHPGTHSLES